MNEWASEALNPVNRAAVAGERMLTLSVGQQAQPLTTFLAFSPTTDVEARARGQKDVRMSSCELRVASFGFRFEPHGVYAMRLHWVLSQ